jgi:cytochrome c biogenesis protein
MRFSISLLSLISIASVIGTVIKQNEPAINYVNQLGPFWSQVFAVVGITQVYSAWWFLVILAFLVVSTSLCIARNAPKILADLRQYKEHLAPKNLQSFHHRGQADLPGDLAQAFAHVTQALSGQGWRAKVQERPGLGRMVAARKGAVNKLGYIAAHSAIVLICIGGLLDGDLVVRMQMWWQNKSSYSGEGFLRDVPAQHRLGPNTLSFRGNIEVPEGSRRSAAIINQKNGVVVQDLPFDIELKRFVVDYYSTGMPRLFSSEIVVHDHATGSATPATVKVNEPAFHSGVAIYQSSFDDGGSGLNFQVLPMHADGHEETMKGRVGTQTALPGNLAPELTVEFTGLRVINVENFSEPQTQATDVRSVNLVDRLNQHLGSGVKSNATKVLRNVGPSVSYKLRDAANQAREFNNYMLPVELDGQRVFLAGMRDTPSEPFRYLRIPVDDADSPHGWVRLRRALLDPQQRSLTVARFVQTQTNTQAIQPEMAASLKVLAETTMSLFVGAKITPDPQGGTPLRGLAALAMHVQTNVPPADQERISGLMLKVLSGCLFDILNSTRRAATLAPLQGQETATQTFLTQSLVALSDSMDYTAPVLLTLTDYQQIQASTFQVTRSPGKTIVYLGCICLIIGVFAMLYIRERRLWIWLEPLGTQNTRISVAMSTTRRTLDMDAEFNALKTVLLNKAGPT